MIKDFRPRLYQQTILGVAAQKNCMVILPTGLGKTAIAFLLAAQRLKLYPNSKILMLAPTKPLCEQHVVTIKKHLNIPEKKVVLFTGNVKPEKRAELWKASKVIVSTPQGLENDVINKRISLKEVSLLAFDESHHATGDYAYVWLAQHYHKTSPYSKILALTASPGSDLEKIKEVCQNLYIDRVEVRTERDADVQPYIQKIKKNWVKVEFPKNLQKIQNILKLCIKGKLMEAMNYGFCNSSDLNKGQLLALQREIQKNLSQGDRSFEALRSISLIAEALKVEHALELLETQDLSPLLDYFQKIYSEVKTTKVKAVKNLCLDPHFKSAFFLTQELVKGEHQHPKLLKLIDIINEDREKKIMIFTQFRATAEKIVEELEKIKVKNHIFVGQAKKNGLGFSQKEQKMILDQFRNDKFKVLVTTSVSEEGLDIPKVDKVIFYEPVPSAIRSIQRRGRTGRLEEGEVTILVTEGTRDEGYRWSAHHKEKRMYRNLDKLKEEISSLNVDRQPTLKKFIKEESSVVILADHREKNNRIVKELINIGVSVKTTQLTTADYVLSGEVGVELKKTEDFVNSIVDGRLLTQVKDLKQRYPKSVLIIEGENDLYSVRRVHANAIRGMLASISLGFNVPILYTKNPVDTAALLAVMAKREQDKGRDFSYHPQKPKSLDEQQKYVVSSFPSIGPSNAQKLLEHFGSIKKIVNATLEELTQVEGIGKKLAEQIGLLVEKRFKY